MTEINKFRKALESIATFWTDMYDHTDRDGVVSERNRFGFIQDKLLNGIAYQLANAAEYTTEKTLPQAKAAVQRALRAHDGTEIAELTLQRSVEWVQRLTEQLDLVEKCLAVAEEVYAKHTGKEFSYGRRAQIGEGQVETPAMAAAKALGIVGNTAAGSQSVEPLRSQPMERLPDQHGRGRDTMAKRRAAKAAVNTKPSSLNEKSDIKDFEEMARRMAANG
jgi:hypothetical protein